MIGRREFLVSAAGAAAFAQTRKPNIVLVLADDLGYGDLGCYGQRQIRTPHIDPLASEGVRFTQAYSGATVCAPSRCCLMTGYHTGHSRTRGNMYPDLPLRPRDTTIAELLNGAGYRTGLFGKWALGQLGSTGFPTRKGFEEYFGFFGQSHAHNYYPEHLLDNETPHILRENMGSRKIYAPDVIQDRALKFITKSDDRPLFAHLTYTLPHANNELGTASGNGMEVAPGTKTYADRDWPQVERDMASMVTQLDTYVGHVIAALPKGRNTLVIFSSDNGPHAEGGHSPKFFESSGELRGIKRGLYEGGIRVPMIGWWPGRIAPRVSDQTWAHWDVLPTLCEVAGVAAPRGIRWDFDVAVVHRRGPAGAARISVLGVPRAAIRAGGPARRLERCANQRGPAGGTVRSDGGRERAHQCRRGESGRTSAN